MAANMGADTLKNNLSNPAKLWLWEAMFVNPIGGGDADVLDTRCRSAGLPGRSVGEIILPYKGTPGLIYPGKLQMSHSWRTVFVESTDKQTFDALYGWHQAIVNARTGVGGLDTTIKSDIYFKTLTQAGDTWLTIQLIGCYPADIAEVSMSYDDTGELVFPVTWAYDRWEEVS